jgi:hypothetical protein
MLKRIPLLLAILLAVGSISTSVLAQEDEGSGTESTTETKPAEGDAEPECD